MRRGAGGGLSKFADGCLKISATKALFTPLQ
jgi:hypothetical protein